MRLHGQTFLAYCTAYCLLLCACSVSVNAATDDASGPAAVTVTVNPTSKHPISPYIYGINIATTHRRLTDRLDLGSHWRQPLDRLQLGNQCLQRRQRLSVPERQFGLSSSREPGAAVSGLIAEDQKNGMASMVTVQMQGLVAGDDQWPGQRRKPSGQDTLQEGFLREEDGIERTIHASNRRSRTTTYTWTSSSGRSTGSSKARTSLAPSRRHSLCSSRWTMSPKLWKSTHLEIQGKTGISGGQLHCQEPSAWALRSRSSFRIW